MRHSSSLRVVGSIVVLASVAAGCGEAPVLDEELEAAQIVAPAGDNNCATGNTANATRYLGQSASYARSATSADAPGCRPTTIVDFFGVTGQKYRFNTTTTFNPLYVNTAAKCADSVLGLRVLKIHSDGTYEQVYFQNNPGTWSTFGGGTCTGENHDILKPSDYTTGLGDYRVRALAVRSDGHYDGLQVIGAVWQ